MIVDTSALIAILRAEPEASLYAEAIESAGVRRLSAASYVEVGAVIDRAGDAIASRRVDELLAVAGIEIEVVTASQALLAREAYRDFGKGSGHPARLNFGDCFPMHWPRPQASPCCSRAPTSGTPTSPRLSLRKRSCVGRMDVMHG